MSHNEKSVFSSLPLAPYSSGGYLSVNNPEAKFPRSRVVEELASLVFGLTLPLTKDVLEAPSLLFGHRPILRDAARCIYPQPTPTQAQHKAAIQIVVFNYSLWLFALHSGS